MSDVDIGLPYYRAPAEVIETIRETSLWKEQPVHVSGVFIAYNQESFVQQALISVLRQKYPMDLIVSDDSSTDRTPFLIRSALEGYQGRHRIRLRSGSRNLGVCGNQNATIRLAEGELIVLFEGDDESVPERIAKIVGAYLLRKRQVAALGSAVRFKYSGGRMGAIVWPNVDRGPHGCGLSFRRDVFFEIGPISRRLIAGDIALCMRSLFVPEGGIFLIQDPLVHYRVHDKNVSKLFRWDFSSIRALRECCSKLVKNEVARIFELRKIRRYCQRLSVDRDDLERDWQTLFRLSRARANLVLAVSRRPRLYWVWPAIVACKFPVWRGKALRVIAVALFPWIAGFYKFARAQGRRMYASEGRRAQA